MIIYHSHNHHSCSFHLPTQVFHSWFWIVSLTSTSSFYILSQTFWVATSLSRLNMMSIEGDLWLVRPQMDHCQRWVTGYTCVWGTRLPGTWGPLSSFPDQQSDPASVPKVLNITRSRNGVDWSVVTLKGGQTSISSITAVSQLLVLGLTPICLPIRVLRVFATCCPFRVRNEWCPC